MNKIWSKAEKDFIRANAAIVKDEQLAVSLTRLTGRHITLHSVRRARIRLGIRKKRGRGVCALVKFKILPPTSLGLVISAPLS